MWGLNLWTRVEGVSSASLVQHICNLDLTRSKRTQIGWKGFWVLSFTQKVGSKEWIAKQSFFFKLQKKQQQNFGLFCTYNRIIYLYISFWGRGGGLFQTINFLGLCRGLFIWPNILGGTNNPKNPTVYTISKQSGPKGIDCYGSTKQRFPLLTQKNIIFVWIFIIF